MMTCCIDPSALLSSLGGAGVSVMLANSGRLRLATPWPPDQVPETVRPLLRELVASKDEVTHYLTQQVKQYLAEQAASAATMGLAEPAEGCPVPAPPTHSEQPIVVADIETTALDPAKGRIVLISWADGNGSGVERSPESLRRMLADAGIMKVFHNAAFDVSWLEHHGYRVVNYADSMVLAQVLSNNEGSHSLVALAKAKLGVELDKALQKADCWTGLITELHEKYSRKDAETTFALFQALRDEAKAAGPGICAAARRERHALPAIIRLQRDGLAFDAESWRLALQGYITERDQVAVELKQELQSQINLASPAQLKTCLQNRGINVQNTNDETLALFEADFPVLMKIRHWRELHKLTTGYGSELLDKVSPDGRIHASWRLIGATTGRMSCSGPNLQQVPHVLRSYFRAPAGRVLVIADYSQIELRVAAELAGCRPMIGAFRAGEDLHRKTAAMILGKPAGDVSKAERQVAKAANFGLIYGMTPQGLKARVKTMYGMDLSDDDADRFREGFFRLYPQMKSWQWRQKQAAEIRTVGGRVWRNLTRPGEGYGWRNRLNYPVQGTAAEGLKESLALITQDLPEQWKLCAVVHDEVVLEVTGGEAEQAREYLRQRMIGGMSRLVRVVPVEVDVTINKTWEKG